MLKYVLAAALAFSLAAAPTFAKEQTTSGTKETSGTKHHKKKDKAEATSDEKGAVAINNTICPISGHDVNSMGKPFQVTYKGQTVNLCCIMCKDKFLANAESNIEKAKESAKK
jgi:YHS domain-containing protein